MRVDYDKNNRSVNRSDGKMWFDADIHYPVLVTLTRC